MYAERGSKILLFVRLRHKDGRGETAPYTFLGPATYVTRQGERPMSTTRDPEKLGGQPCIRDLRITVRRALQAMALYPDREELRREYPDLEDEDLRQALEFAAAQLEDRSIDLPAAS
jgi:uncharacterized protein (DUF433 family)